jgi:hypothetical protein
VLGVGIVVLLLGSAGEAETPPETTPLAPPTLAVTAAVDRDRVRFVAPNSVYEVRLEVFDDDREKVFDSGPRFGNVLDWDAGQAGERGPVDGTFVCVVTVRDISGRLGRRWVGIQRGAGGLSWVDVATAREGAEQRALADAFGDDGALVAASRPGAGVATTLLGHDGGGGFLASGAGGLSFRSGDFLAGRDVERMRLTAEGSLGIGVRSPQAKLDVAGVIRTGGGIRFPDGTLQTTAAAGGARPVMAGRLSPIAAALVDGAGTPNVLAKWTSGSNLGNSTLVEVGGNIGVGTAAPGGVFDLPRASGGDILQRFWNTSTGGAKLRYVAADGATSQLQLTDFDEWIAAIAGDETTGLQLRVRGTSPEDNDEVGLANSPRLTITREGKVGINVTTPSASLDVRSGLSSTSVHIGDTSGVLSFASDSYARIEGFSTHQMRFTASNYVFDDGSVLPATDGLQSLGTSLNRWSAVWAANGAIQTSDARLKRNVTDLGYGLHEVLQLRPVSYEWRDHSDGRRHLGLIAQDVQRVVPEAVVAGDGPRATLGMAYTDLVPVLVKAIQEQQGTLRAQEGLLRKQQGTIDEQRASLGALSADNADLRARIEALERAAGGPVPPAVHR